MAGSSPSSSSTPRRAEVQATPPAESLRGVVQTIDSAVRAHVDWVGRLDASAGATFALVLPEAGIAEAPSIKDRVLNALRQYAHPAANSLSSGSAWLRSTARPQALSVDAKEMLDVAAHCLECPGRAGREQMRSVQRSVACHVAIACRHGYVVDSECSLKASGADGRRHGLKHLRRACVGPAASIRTSSQSPAETFCGDSRQVEGSRMSAVQLSADRQMVDRSPLRREHPVS